MRLAESFLTRQTRARPLTCLSVAFLLGVIARRRLSVPTAACAFAFVAALGLIPPARKRGLRLLAFALLPAGFLAGMCRMGLYMDSVKPVETRYSVEMEGRVDSEPFLNPDTGRLIFRFDLETLAGEPSSLRVRLYLRGDEAPLRAVSYGQRLRLTGHIWRPDPVTNPYEFDFGDYLARQHLNGYATAKIEDVEITGVRRDVRSAIVSARLAISDRIDVLFPDSAGMMRTLVLGDRSLLGGELRDSLNRTGTAHLISISGLHVTVLAALLALLLRCFMPRRTANVVAIALLVPYGALIGFSAPFVRALAMFALLAFAPIAGRSSDPITRLCAAMLLFLLARPESVGDAGFVLSFSASAGILLLMPPLMRITGLDALINRRPSPNRLRRSAVRLAIYLPALLCASLAAQLATLPAVIAFFGVQPIVSLPCNLLCVPLCMAGFIAGLAALMLSVISMPVAILAAALPDMLFGWLFSVTRFFAGLPSSGVRVGRYPAVLLLAHWLIIIAASDLSAVRFSRRAWMPLALIAVAALSSLLCLARAWNFSLVFLDADQADCAVVRTRGHTYLFDVGDTYTPSADYLNATCLHLDGIVLSHPHEDHAGGLAEILNSFVPDVIYVPRGWFEAEETSPAVAEGIEQARRMGVEIRMLSAGDVIDLPGAAKLEIYSPSNSRVAKTVNDLSLLALVTCEDQRALFTGDLSVEGEPPLIPRAEVLKVAHHGSDKATSKRFLRQCSPAIAVISVGENNYGHPSPETVERLVDAGAQVYQTRECGAVTLTFRRGAWHIKRFLEASHELE